MDMYKNLTQTCITHCMNYCANINERTNGVI